MVMDRHSDGVRLKVKRQLELTAACIATERFGDALADAERDHLAVCQRCQAELALWHEIDASTTGPEEEAAVRWIAGELRRRRGRSHAAARSWLAGLRGPRLFAAAASILLVAGGGYVFWDPEPQPGEPQSADHVYRTAQITVVGPVGDLQSPPNELKWVPVDGAVSYDVRVVEVDGTSLWRGSSPGPHVSMPAAVVARFVPGKTIVWEVTARAPGGAPVAVSGTYRFRVGTSTFPRSR
jgi:hypothetical protein